MPWLSQLIETITTLEWWQFIAILIAAVLIRVFWRFDLNKALESLTGHRERKRLEKEVNNCPHAWLVYRKSNWADCVSCPAWIRGTKLEVHTRKGCCHQSIVDVRFLNVTPSGKWHEVNTPHNKLTVTK